MRSLYIGCLSSASYHWSTLLIRKHHEPVQEVRIVEKIDVNSSLTPKEATCELELGAICGTAERASRRDCETSTPGQVPEANLPSNSP